MFGRASYERLTIIANSMFKSTSYKMLKVASIVAKYVFGRTLYEMLAIIAQYVFGKTSYELLV